MFNKKKNEQANICADILIDGLKIRKEMFNINRDSEMDFSDKSLMKFRNKLIPVINKIINNGNGFILTKDLLYYLTYLSIRMIDYQSELLRFLRHISCQDDKGTAEMYKKYFGCIMFDKYLNSKDPIENYINRMDGAYKEAFLKYQNNYKNLLGTFVRGYEYDLMDQVSSLIFAKCAKDNKLEYYDELSKRYFANPRETIDYFITNGFMNDNYQLIYQFDDFIYEDMGNGVKNTCEIK